MEILVIKTVFGVSPSLVFKFDYLIAQSLETNNLLFLYLQVGDDSQGDRGHVKRIRDEV